MPTIVATAGAVNANCYCTLAEAETYHESQLNVSVWTDADDDDKIIALIMATRLLDEHVEWKGYKVINTQALRWPRYEVEDRDGLEYFDHETIPTFLKHATAEFARWLLTENRLEERGFGIQSVSADVVSVQFDKTDERPVVPPAVRSMIAPYGDVGGSGIGMVKLVRA